MPGYCVDNLAHSTKNGRQTEGAAEFPHIANRGYDGLTQVAIELAVPSHDFWGIVFPQPPTELSSPAALTCLRVGSRIA